MEYPYDELILHATVEGMKFVPSTRGVRRNRKGRIHAGCPRHDLLGNPLNCGHLRCDGLWFRYGQSHV